MAGYRTATRTLAARRGRWARRVGAQRESGVVALPAPRSHSGDVTNWSPWVAPANSLLTSQNGVSHVPVLCHRPSLLLHCLPSSRKEIDEKNPTPKHHRRASSAAAHSKPKPPTNAVAVNQVATIDADQRNPQLSQSFSISVILRFSASEGSDNATSARGSSFAARRSQASAFK